MTSNNNVIITLHAGLVEWLKRRGIEGPVYTRVKHNDIKGKHVFGSLPVYLAASAARYTIITMSKNSGTPKDLTADEMDELDARMETFEIRKKKLFDNKDES